MSWTELKSLAHFILGAGLCRNRAKKLVKYKALH